MQKDLWGIKTILKETLNRFVDCLISFKTYIFITNVPLIIYISLLCYWKKLKTWKTMIDYLIFYDLEPRKNTSKIFFSIIINNRLRWPGNLKYYPDKVKILWFWFESVDDLLLSLQSAFFGNQFGKAQTAHAQWVKKISKRGRIGLYENLGD